MRPEPCAWRECDRAVGLYALSHNELYQLAKHWQRQLVGVAFYQWAHFEDYEHEMIKEPSLIGHLTDFAVERLRAIGDVLDPGLVWRAAYDDARDDFKLRHGWDAFEHEFEDAAQAPTFQKVIAYATGGSQPLHEYLQQIFGYGVTGKTSEKAFFVFYGPQDTGKTTVLDAIRETFAEYSTTIQIETLMANRSAELSNNQQSDLADLRGARFAMTSEVESGQRLREALIKRITQGTGKIKAARKFQDPIQFNESHKLFIDANHRPEIRDGVGVWTRLHCVPFMRVLPAAEQDRGIHEKLAAERAGIAAWVVAGALAWRKAGRLVKPKEVEAAGQEYQESQDVMGDWIAERCELEPNAWAESSKLLASFNQYATENGGRGLDARKFKERLLARGGIKHDKRKGANVYEGIGVKSEFGSAPGA